MIYSIFPVQFTCLTGFFAQPQSQSSLVFYLLVWHLLVHTPYTSSPNHCLLFATHSHTNTNLFCCSTKIMSSNPSLSLNSHLKLYLTICISARWSAMSFSFLTGHISLSCNILLCIQLLYGLPLIINDISLLVSNVTNCQNLFHPIRILASRAASASSSTLNMSPK